MSITNQKKTVFVGLSGGVDSSVSALLLKQQGFKVVGVFIKAWYPNFLPCTWRDEMRDAMRVCAKLEIPFLICDLEKEYKEKVINYLIEEYKAGRTPNPDVMCNKYIKFDGFLKFAIQNGADYIATGHYAKKQIQNDKNYLCIPKDLEKDQTYFLAEMKQEALDKTIFPLGDLQKKEVREIAQKHKLHTAIKKDSQGLCFIGHIDLKEFLKKYLNLKKGEVLDEKGCVIGWHEGALVYTQGQRHGFHLHNKSINQDKLYVIAKDLDKNTITLGTKKQTTRQHQIKLKEINFLNANIRDLSDALIKIRYRGRNHKILKINEINEYSIFEIEALDEFIAMGQLVAFYKDKKCLGGGIITA